MELPPAVTVSDAAVGAICARYGFPQVTARPLASRGITNTIYALGDDGVLRVPRDHPNFIATLTAETVAAPLAWELGLRTPRLLAYDTVRDLLPVPFTIYERVDGVPLEIALTDPTTASEVWRALGRDLACLHAGAHAEGVAATLDTEPPDDPRRDPRIWLERSASEGYLDVMEARWLGDWLELLAPQALTPVAPHLLHADTQAMNILVDPVTLDYRALIDWGDARWADPAIDFVGMPLRAVPWTLRGYREAGEAGEDATIEARVLWQQIALALRMLRRAPAPDQSWAERPLTRLVDTLRLTSEGPATDAARWADLLPR